MGSARNRRKREQRLRKRQEQRHYRRLVRSLDSAPKIVRRPPGMAKMSDALVAFAQPLLDAIPSGAPVEAYEGELLLGAMVWNFLVTLDREYDRDGAAVQVQEEEMCKILDALALGTDMSDDDAIDLLETLAARKRDLFPDERRLIGDVRAEFRGDRVHVVALSTLPL